VPASIQIAFIDRSASANFGAIRIGSQSSQRCHTSSRICPVRGSNGSRGVPSGSAENAAEQPSSPSSVSSPSCVNDGRERKLSHQAKTSPSYARKARAAGPKSCT